MSYTNSDKRSDKRHYWDKSKKYSKEKPKNNEKNKLIIKQGPFPYNFVPVKSNLTIKDSPSDHLCLELDDKNCGEINLSITTLTPTICGHFQTKYKDVSEKTKEEIDKNLNEKQKFDDEKSVVEPLILDDENGNIGPVILPSTSIKGMIRQSVSSLLSAPMSKVDDKQFAYRPNLVVKNPKKGSIDSIDYSESNNRINKIAINYNNKIINIPKNILRQFNKTLDMLEKEKQRCLKNRINKDDEVFFEIRSGEKEPQKDGSNIISIGITFRYKWLYRDSVCMKKGQIRDCIYNKQEASLKDGHLTETNIQRSLFGFVDDNSKKSKDETIVKSFAGRISPNCAIEQIDNKTNDERFVNHNGCFYLVLKPLGSPKPSAVEMYLTQDNISKRNDQGIVCTYGDFEKDESAGDLRGRKGYLHQSPCCDDKASYLNNPREESYLSEQSSIVGYVSKSGTIFKSKIRFQNLEDWELGALIMAISPKPEYVKKIYEKMGIEIPDFKEFEEFITSPKDDSNYFAQKIGHGRPLGLGSIFCKIDGLNLLKDNEKGTIDFNKQEDINKYIEAFADILIQKLDGKKKQDWFNQILLPWLKMRKFKDTCERKYWTGIIKDKETIYNFHTYLRSLHSRGRKSKKENSNEDFLKETREYILKDILQE